MLCASPYYGRAFLAHRGVTSPVVVTSFLNYSIQGLQEPSEQFKLHVFSLLERHTDLCLVNVYDLPDDNVLLELGLKNTYLYLVESLPVEKIRELLVKAEQLGFVLNLCFEV